MTHILNLSNVEDTYPGTFKYMSPERIRNEKYSARCDLWSFGVVIWEMLTARIPFDGMSMVLVASKVALEGMRLPVPADAPLRIKFDLGEAFGERGARGTLSRISATVASFLDSGSEWLQPEPLSGVGPGGFQWAGPLCSGCVLGFSLEAV